MRLPSWLFNLFTKTTLAKGDFPEVTAVLVVITQLMKQHWRAATADAIKQLEAALDQLEFEEGSPDAVAVARAANRDRALEDLVAALLLAMSDAISRPFKASTADAVRRAVDKLLLDGARVAGAALGVQSIDLAVAVRTASADLPLMLRALFERREDKLKALLRDFLTRGRARRVVSDVVLGLEPPSDSPLPRSRAEWLVALGTLLDTQARSLVPAVTDLWAYRWFNIGGVLGGVAAGAQVFQLRNNPPFGPDSHTTSLCFWLHGKIIPADRLMSQFNSYKAAVASGDVQAVLNAWPLINPLGSIASFEEAFVNMGMPPYHFFCRTKAYPIFG